MVHDAVDPALTALGFELRGFRILEAWVGGSVQGLRAR